MNWQGQNCIWATHRDEAALRCRERQLLEAEAKLKSIREMVAYYTEDDDSLLARIRAIVEGK